MILQVELTDEILDDLGQYIIARLFSDGYISQHTVSKFLTIELMRDVILRAHYAHLQKANSEPIKGQPMDYMYDPAEDDAAETLNWLLHDMETVKSDLLKRRTTISIHYMKYFLNAWIDKIKANEPISTTVPIAAESGALCRYAVEPDNERIEKAEAEIRDFYKGHQWTPEEIETITSPQNYDLPSGAVLWASF